MPEDPLDLYDDVIVIPFEIPWRVARSGGEEGRTDQPDPNNTPGVSPVEPMQVDRPPDPAPVSSRSGEGRLVMARAQGQPSLAISGMIDGELTLWRLRGETAPAKALIGLKLDLDGSLWDSRGQFGGLLWPNETALLHPDWLRSIGAWLAEEQDEPPSNKPELESSKRARVYAEPGTGDEAQFLTDAITASAPGNAEPGNVAKDAIESLPLFWLALGFAAALRIGVRAGVFTLARVIARRFQFAAHPPRLLVRLVKPKGQFIGVRAKRAGRKSER